MVATVIWIETWVEEFTRRTIYVRDFSKSTKNKKRYDIIIERVALYTKMLQLDKFRVDLKFEMTKTPRPSLRHKILISNDRLNNKKHDTSSLKPIRVL